MADSAELGTLRRGLRSAGLGAVSNMALGLLSALVISRMFEPKVLGAFTLAYAAVGIITQFSTVSEQTALVRALASTEPGSNEASALTLAVFTLSAALTAVVALIIAGASGWYLVDVAREPQLVLPMVVLVVVYSVFENATWNMESVFSAYGAAGTLAIVRTLQALVLFGVTVGVGTSHRTMWALTAGSVASSLFGFVVRGVLVRRHLRFRVGRASYVAGLRQLPEIIRFGLKVLPGSLAQGLVAQLPTWVLGGVAPLGAVGLYGRAQGITARVGDLNYRVGAVVFPSFVRQSEEDPTGGHLVQGILSSLRRTFVPVSLVLFAAAGASRSALSILGANYVPAENVLVVLLVVIVVGLADTILREAIVAAGHPRPATHAGLLSLAVCGATVYPLTRGFGGTGAAASLLIGLSAGLVHKVWSIRRLFPDAWQATRLGRQTLVLAAVLAAVFGATHGLQAIGGTVLVVISAGVAGVGGICALLVVRRRRGRHVDVGAADRDDRSTAATVVTAG